MKQTVLLDSLHSAGLVGIMLGVNIVCTYKMVYNVIYWIDKKKFAVKESRLKLPSTWRHVQISVT